MNDTLDEKRVLGVLTLPLNGFGPRAGARKGLVGAGALGFVFGLGLSPRPRSSSSATSIGTRSPGP